MSAATSSSMAGSAKDRRESETPAPPSIGQFAILPTAAPADAVVQTEGGGSQFRGFTFSEGGN